MQWKSVKLRFVKLMIRQITLFTKLLFVKWYYQIHDSYNYLKKIAIHQKLKMIH